MEGEDCNFPPDSSDDHSQRGSVASSATLSRGKMQQILKLPTENMITPHAIAN